MKRRSYLWAMLVRLAGIEAASAQKGNCDLAVSPAREQEMLRNFHTIFKPAAEKFPGIPIAGNWQSQGVGGVMWAELY